MRASLKRDVTLKGEALKQAVEKAKKTTDEEYGLKTLLEKIRKLYFQYEIAGEISITKSSLVSATLTCEVDGTSGHYYQDPEKDVQVHKITDAVVLGIIKLMVIGVDKMLNDLIHRSKAYWDKSYKDDMTLAGSFSFSDPKGYLTTEINCSATIKSMHEHIFRMNEFELTFGFPVDKLTEVASRKEDNNQRCR